MRLDISLIFRTLGNLQTPIVVFQGGLGNQLYQWSFAHSIVGSRRFIIDPLYKISEVGTRNFELQEVCKNCNHVRRDNTGNLVIPKWRVLYHFLDRLWEFRIFRPFVEFFGYVREDPRVDQEQSLDISSAVNYAKGYFQKQSNVDKVMDSVRAEIIPILEQKLSDARRKFPLKKEYTVIHVRRGDYDAEVFSPIIIGTLSDHYFIQGLNQMLPSNLVLLTENRADVSDLVRVLKPMLVLDKFETTPWETLAIIYGATKFLGSNSSLSWWGARLCSDRGGEVWLPSKWSFWNNVNVGDYHFAKCKIAEVSWVQDRSGS